MVSGTALITTIFFLQALGQTAVWLYWFQVKEYRLDRFTVYLRSSDGQKELIILIILFKLVSLAIGFFSSRVFIFYILAIVCEATYFAIMGLTKRLRRPVFTKRIWRILLITLFLICLSIFYPINDYWIKITLAEISLISGPFLGIYITLFSVRSTLEREMDFASEKLKKFSPKVIAITGSYGKTTTKDFITQLLSEKYEVLSTYKNENTHFGIIRRINSELRKEHKFLITEVGAYKRGEIKDIAKILKPSVAVITGIEPQHLELFGNLDNLKRAKFELIESLGNGDWAFFNLTNPKVQALLSWSKKEHGDVRNFTYGVSKKLKFDANSTILNTNQEGITFKFVLKRDERIIKTNILSERLIQNLTCAIAIARKFEVSWKEIERVCRVLVLPQGTMNVFKTFSGIHVIDDSYNATPSGMEAALELLSQYVGSKKFILTTGIIELGTESKTVHRKLGKLMGEICDLVLLRNEEFLVPIREGMNNPGKARLFKDPKKMIDFIKKEAGKDSVILVEGKLPQVVNYLKNI